MQSLVDYYNKSDIFALFTDYASAVVLVIGTAGIVFGRRLRRSAFSTTDSLLDFAQAIVLAHSTILFVSCLFNSFVVAEKLLLGIGTVAAIAGVRSWEHFQTLTALRSAPKNGPGS